MPDHVGGHESREPVLFGPDGKPITKRSKRLSLTRRLRNVVWRRLKTYWKLLLSLLTLTGIGTIYQLIPTLTAVSLSVLDPYDPSSAQFSILVNNSSINDVAVDCQDNKILFANRFTVKLTNSSLMDTYSVKKIDTGEQVSISCPQAWRLFLEPTKGFLTFGDMPRPGIVMRFELQDGKTVWSEKQGVGLPEDILRYRQVATSAIDLTIVIRYRVRILPFWKRVNRFHFVTKESSDQKLTWVFIPNAESIIPDAPGPVWTVDGMTGHSAGPLR
jgi:hypothetical protein